MKPFLFGCAIGCTGNAIYWGVNKDIFGETLFMGLAIASLILALRPTHG